MIREQDATRGIFALLLLLALWYGLLFEPVLSSGDDFAYASIGVDLAEGRPLVHRFESPLLSSRYTPTGTAEGQYASRFAIGEGLLLAVVYLAGGYPAMFLVNPVLALLGVYVLYQLTALLCGDRRTALLAASLLGVLPPTIFYAGGIGTSVPSLAFVLIAIYWHARYVHARQCSQPGVAPILLCAFVAGVCLLIRNTNVLAIAPLLLHQLMLGRDAPKHRALHLGAAFGIVGAFIAMQVAYNLSVFGSLIGGYADEIGPGGGLSLSYVPHHLPRYLLMLCAMPPLGLVALGVVSWKRRGEWLGLYPVLAVIVLSFVLFYSAWHSFGFGYQRAFVGGVRFLVPTLPLLCLCIAIAAADLGFRRRRVVAVGLCGLLALCIASGVLTRELRAFKTRLSTHRDSIYAHTDSGALLIGPAQWRKLFFPRDGQAQGRVYASYDQNLPIGEIVSELERLIDLQLASGHTVYSLGSERGDPVVRDQVISALRARYRVLSLFETHEPYALRVERVRAASR